jgi:hypothetical protein
MTYRQNPYRQIPYRRITYRPRRRPSRVELRLARLISASPVVQSRAHRIDLIDVANADPPLTLTWRDAST